MLLDAQPLGRTSPAEPRETAAPGDVEADSIRRLDLAQTMAGLDERDRELIALRYGADLTARQIGELLGQRTNAVEVALHRALGRLREQLAGETANRAYPDASAPATRATPG